MINLTKYELKLIAGNRGIKNYQNMSKEKLLSAIVKSERITENLSQNGLERIARMQNLSENELEQITRMQNLSQKNSSKSRKQDVLDVLLQRYVSRRLINCSFKIKSKPCRT